MNDLAAKIEALLFTEGGSLSLKKIASLLKVKEPEVKAALEQLGQRLQDGALTLIHTDTEATLAVAQSVSPTIREAYQSELEKDIGEAGLEVLAIVLYRGQSTRAQIDYIRGVNTSSTIRTLLSRGMLERVGNPEDGREYLYRPTVELLTHLGINNSNDLPEHAAITAELTSFEAKAKELPEENPYGTTN